MSRIEGRRASQSLSRKSLLQLPLSKSNFARELESNKRESFIIKRHLPQKKGKMGRWRLSKHFSIRSILPDFPSMKCFKTSISLRKSILDQLASLVSMENEAFFPMKNQRTSFITKANFKLLRQILGHLILMCQNCSLSFFIPFSQIEKLFKISQGERFFSSQRICYQKPLVLLYQNTDAVLHTTHHSISWCKKDHHKHGAQ